MKGIQMADEKRGIKRGLTWEDAESKRGRLQFIIPSFLANQLRLYANALNFAIRNE